MKNRLAVIIGCLILVGIIGVVDYFTGDYSLVIFYLIPISGAAWYSGRRSGLLLASASWVTRIASDYALHGAELRSSLHYWNFTVEALFFFIVGTLVTTLKNALDKD